MGCGSSIAEVEYKAWEAQHVEEIGRELTPEERQEERTKFMQRLMGEPTQKGSMSDVWFGSSKKGSSVGHFSRPFSRHRHTVRPSTRRMKMDVRYMMALYRGSP